MLEGLKSWRPVTRFLSWRAAGPVGVGLTITGVVGLGAVGVWATNELMNGELSPSGRARAAQELARTERENEHDAFTQALVTREQETMEVARGESLALVLARAGIPCPGPIPDRAGITADRTFSRSTAWTRSSSSAFSPATAWPSCWRCGTCCAPGPVCQTLSSQIQSNPVAARRSNSASGISSSVAERPKFCDNSVSQTRVLIWYNKG